MATLWILIFGLVNAGHSSTLIQRPEMQAIATYETFKECNAAAQELFKGTKGTVAADVLCLPTGVSDPVGG